MKKRFEKKGIVSMFRSFASISGSPQLARKSMREFVAVNSLATNSGYVAVVLLIFVVAGTVISTAALGMSMANLAGVSAYEEGSEAIIIAQGGAENAMLRLLRDPNYTGETLSIGSGTATITVTSTASSSAITSVGVMGTKKRKVQVNVSQNAGVLSVTSWAEVYN